MSDALALLQEHQQQPRNLGKIVGCDAVGDVGSIVVGDALRMFLTIKDDVIEAAKFQVFGANNMIAAASVLTEMLPGKTISEARRLLPRHICSELNDLHRYELPAQVWALDALNIALDSYQGLDTPRDEDLQALVCRCHGVTEEQIRNAITEDACDDVDKIAALTFAGTGCGSCKVDVQKVLDDVIKPTQPSTVGGSAAPQLGRIPTMHKVNAVITQEFEAEIAEMASQIELWDIAGDQVVIKLTGPLRDAGTDCEQMLDRLQRRIQDEVAPQLSIILAEN